MNAPPKASILAAAPVTPARAAPIGGSTIVSRQPACAPVVISARERAEFSPEATLLIAALRFYFEDSSSRSLDDALGRSLDWSEVLSLAERHRVRPVLFASLSKMGTDIVPKSVLAALRDFTAANTRQSLFLTRELFWILELLQSQDISAAPFKGPILSIQAYGNPGLREAGDLDLLVRRNDIVRAWTLCIDAGFKPGYPTAKPAEVACLSALGVHRQTEYLRGHCEHHLIRPSDGANIDLHWALALRQFALRVTPEALEKWVTPQTVGGRSINAFAPEEMLLVLCINGAKDAWQRLDRICDVAALLQSHPKLDWSRVLPTAEKLGLLRMLYAGLTLAQTFFGADIPADVRQRISATSAVAGIVRRISRGLFVTQHTDVEESSFGKFLLQLSLRDCLRDRLSFLLAQLEPTVGDWVAFPLPPAVQFMHYGLRPFRLVWRAVAGRMAR